MVVKIQLLSVSISLAEIKLRASIILTGIASTVNPNITDTKSKRLKIGYFSISLIIGFSN